MLLQMGKHGAMMIATRFFEQYHTNVQANEAALKGNTWQVTISTGLASKKIRRVKIDAISGQILEFW